MKMTALIACGLAAAAMAVPAAQAQDRIVQRERVVTNNRTTVVHDNGRRYHRARRVCTVRYRHHQRIRTCRVVRYR